MLSARTARRPQQAGAQSVSVPVPVGGLNTVDVGSDMPDADAVLLSNMVSAEQGLRARLGWREWCTNVGAGEVRSILPFNGSASSGGNNRLFATTPNKIYDVSASSIAPTDVLTFAATSADAGYGVCHVQVTAAGHFLLYCDEENGYHIYSEGTDSWNKVVPTATVNWAATTAYTAGQYRLNDSGKTYLCITSGTSAGSGGPTGTTADITDGTAHWKYIQHVMSGVDPANLVSVTVWKGRVWFTQKNTAKAWYLDVGAVFGAATAFNFGQQFRAGGHLVGLWNWTIDGGVGIDDHLVAISGGGDVAVYVGTDPTSASTFGLKGVWFVGGLPSGRHVASEFGGDILVVSSVGVVPLSKLVGGANAEDGTQYPTRKIANLFSLYVRTYGTNKGWALRLHPEDNALMVLVPTVAGTATSQLVMSLAKGSWGPYQDLPVFSAEAWGGQLYFGTIDGRVCINDGYTDGRTLADPASSSPVQWYVLGAFTNLKNGRQKMVQLIRPTVLTQGGASTFKTEARYNFNQVALAPVSPESTTAPNAWDSAVWDASKWGGDYAASQRLNGGGGCGTFVAIGVRGTSTSRTVLTAIEVTFTQGGFL